VTVAKVNGVIHVTNSYQDNMAATLLNLQVIISNTEKAGSDSVIIHYLIKQIKDNPYGN